MQQDGNALVTEQRGRGWSAKQWISKADVLRDLAVRYFLFLRFSLETEIVLVALVLLLPQEMDVIAGSEPGAVEVSPLERDRLIVAPGGLTAERLIEEPIVNGGL
jgi:hypothetical protein